MPTVNISRRVEAAPARIWPFLADASRWPEWMPGAQSSQVTNGKSGLGRRQHLELSWGGHAAEIDLEITEWEPERRIGWVHLSDRVKGIEKQFARDIRTRVTLTPAANGAEIAFEGSWEPVGFVGKMLGKTVVQSRANAMFDRAAENLERLAGG